MASLRKMVGTYREELRDGIADVIFWKDGRSWNAEAFWLDGDKFEVEDVFTIVEVKDGWGKLKSAAGWIWLKNSNYCTVLNTVG